MRKPKVDDPPDHSHPEHTILDMRRAGRPARWHPNPHPLQHRHRKHITNQAQQQCKPKSTTIDPQNAATGYTDEKRGRDGATDQRWLGRTQTESGATKHSEYRAERVPRSQSGASEREREACGVGIHNPSTTTDPAACTMCAFD